MLAKTGQLPSKPVNCVYNTARYIFNPSNPPNAPKAHNQCIRLNSSTTFRMCSTVGPKP